MTLRNILIAGALAATTLTAGSLATAGSANAMPLYPHHHGHWGHGWGGGWGGPFGGGIVLNSYPVYRGGDDCYVVRKTRFIPGVGYVKKRVVVCE